MQLKHSLYAFFFYRSKITGRKVVCRRRKNNTNRSKTKIEKNNPSTRRSSNTVIYMRYGFYRRKKRERRPVDRTLLCIPNRIDFDRVIIISSGKNGYCSGCGLPLIQEKKIPPPFLLYTICSSARKKIILYVSYGHI